MRLPPSLRPACLRQLPGDLLVTGDLEPLRAGRARWERVEKPGHELVLAEEDHDRVFPVSGYSIGYVRDLVYGRGIDLGLGGEFTLNDMPDRLDRYYGDGIPYGFQFFLRLRPSLMKGDGMEGMNH